MRWDGGATIIALCGLIALLSFTCALTMGANRTYWPMLRAMFVFLGAAFGFRGTAAIMGLVVDARASLISIAVIAAMMVYAQWFIVRRNTYPRFVPFDMAAMPKDIDPSMVEAALITTESVVGHGAAPREVVEQLDAAIARWHEAQRWKGKLRDALEERRAGRARDGPA